MDHQIETEKYNCLLTRYNDGMQGTLVSLSMLLAELEHLRSRRKTLLAEYPDLELSAPAIPSKLADLLGGLVNEQS